MPEVTTHDIEVMVGGSVLAPAIADTLLDLEVEATYNRPDRCLLRYNLRANEDPPGALDVGKELKVSIKGRGQRAQKEVIFDGEITAIEVEYEVGFAVCVVQAQHQVHRMFRGLKQAVHVRQKYSDIVSKAAQAAGLSATTDATTTVYEHLIQHDETDGDYVTRLAAEINYHVRGDTGKKLLFKKVGSGAASGVTLTHGVNLRSFSVRATAAAQLSKVTVRSWNPKEKKAVVGVASTSTARTDSKAKSAVNSMGGQKELTLAATGLQGELEVVAKAVMERSVEPNLQVDGTCFGEPKLKVDSTVKIEGVSPRFNGDYRISQVRHRYSDVQGFTTEFACRGGTDQSLAELVAHTATTERSAVTQGLTFDGCAVGIVTNNNDDEGLGRVKVKFPTMDDALESHWYRMVLPGAGGPKPHGWYLLPEVNDEVLVIFERNDPRLGYVVGGLFNSKDKPPIDKSKVVTSGNVDQHAFYTKTGAFLLYDDKLDAIQLKSGKENFDLRFEDTKGLTITNKGTDNVITMTADGNITVESKSGNINLTASQGDIVMKAMNVKVEAQQNVDVKATSNLKLQGTAGAEMKGLTATVKADTEATLNGGAKATVSGGGMTEVKGALVKIN